VFLWNFVKDIILKKQFLHPIVSIGLGTPDPSLFVDVEQLLVICFEKEIRIFDLKQDLSSIGLYDLDMTTKVDEAFK